MKSNQQRPTDATENWLRQTLGGHSPEPPADAWQRLAPYLPQRKRRNLFVFVVAFCIAGAVVALALLGMLKYDMSPASPYVVVKNGHSSVQAVPEVLPKVLKKKEAVFSGEKPSTMINDSFLQDHFSRNSSPLIVTGLSQKLTTGATFENHSSKMKTSGVLDFEEKATASSTSFSEKTAPSIIEFLLKKLPGKDPESLLLSENPLFEFQLPAAPILPIKSKAHRFWLNVEAASVLSIRKNLDEIPAGLAFPERYTRPGNGWQVGISLATEPLKNWRVALGMQHLRQTHESAHSASLRLMDGVCLNPHDPGLKEYEFSYTVVSSGKQSDLTLRLQQQNIGSTMPDDEPFSLYMETVHHSAVWRVPLTVERQFGTGKWLAFVRGGAVVDFFGRNTVQITHFSEACQDLCFQSGYSPMIQVSAANKAAFGWLAGAGIERQVYSRVALRVEPFAVGQKGSIQCGLSLGLLFSN